MPRGSGSRGQSGCQGRRGSQSDPTGPMMTFRHNGRKRVNLMDCYDRKGGDPVFNVVGNITGMTDKRSPVSNMKMSYQSRKGAAPELNFDIDLRKESGEDERFVLSNEANAEEKERRVQERLGRLENELEAALARLAFVKRLRTEWTAQKVGLCNRKLKDNPLCNVNANRTQ